MKTIMERWRYKCEHSGTDPFTESKPSGEQPASSSTGKLPWQQAPEFGSVVPVRERPTALLLCNL